MRQHLAWLAVLAVALPSFVGAQQKTGQPGKLYQWTDDKGVVHYGDSIPPEYAKADRNVLNQQGVHAGRPSGALGHGGSTA